MKYWTQRLGAICIALVLLLSPAGVFAESITTFTSDIYPSEDGSFLVTETILYDFGTSERHGIYRTLPTDHPQPAHHWLYERYIDITVESVQQDGNSVPYQVTDADGERTVRIGDPDTTITAAHAYTLTYRVRGGLTYYDSGAVDLYWNVTGSDWGVPIESASAIVHDPNGIGGADATCYVGTPGSTETCAVATAHAATLFGSVALSPGEEFTIAQSLDPNVVARDVQERLTLATVWFVAAVVWLLFVLVYALRVRRMHNVDAPIIAQYEPYADLRPMYTGLVFDGRIDPRDITAGIVHLAANGFFKITRLDKKFFVFFTADDYEVTLKRPYGEVESSFEQEIFKLLFDEDAAVGSSMRLGEFTEASLSSVVGVGSVHARKKANQKLLASLKTAAEKDLLSQGYFESRFVPIAWFVGYTAVGLIVGLLATFVLGAGMAAPLMIAGGTLLGTFVLQLIAYRIRTKKGCEALNHLKGFKEFLSVTDKERFKFHNAPEKSPEQFMAFLPYAIAFGVEEEWAKVFATITIPDPDWYDGNGATFSAVALSDSLGAFNTALTGLSNVGSTASGGGGFSGGGAGGGGGGSW